MRGIREFESSRHKEQISSLWFPLVLALFCGIFYGCYANFNALPTPNLSSYPTLPNFNSRIAREYLTNLTQYGPKVAGSDLNERVIVDYLLDEVQVIRNNMHPNHKLEVDVQVSDGSIFLGSSSTYRGVKNVVVRLGSRGEGEPYHCLLINSHYDTVAVSPGGGDASTMISVMLETLRVLTTQEDTFEHSIIFLFNGCEEIALQASHAFVTQHKWASCAKAVLNLDAAGNGGREILFQTSPGHSWLMKYYRQHAPHPFSSAMGEELFQAGLIPSDTDFRIFRDYGGIPGMDMAYITNGYVYHTKEDRPEIVPDGTLQHTGDNVLALTRALANAAELRDTAAHMDDDAVFFDFMNWFMVYYTQHDAVIVNSVVIVFTIVLQIASYYGQMSCSRMAPVYILVQLISVVAGCGLAVGVGYLYNAVGLSMSWFNNSFLIFPLYMCPMLLCMAIGPAVMRHFSWKMSPWTCVEHALNLHGWLLMLALIAMTVLGVRTGFMVMVPLFFYAISLMVQLLLTFLRASARWKLFLHYLVQIMPFCFYATWTVIAFATFIPLSGRNGINNNTELIISVFAIGMGILLTGFLIPTVPMFKSPIAVSLTFALLWLVGLILAFTSVGFPYVKDTAPQRQTAYHVHRTFYNMEGDIRREQSMFYVRGSDPNQHLTEDYLDLSTRIDGPAECQAEWLCGLPLLFNSGASTSYLLEAPKPVLPNVESDLQLIDVSQVTERGYNYTFRLTCPSNCAIYLAPSDGVTFGKWSLFQHLDDVGRNYPNPRLYFSNYYNLNLVDREDLEFSLEVTVSGTVTGKRLNAGIVAHYTANRHEPYSQEFTDLLSRFPDWTTTSDWISTFKSYEF